MIHKLYIWKSIDKQYIIIASMIFFFLAIIISILPIKQIFAQSAQRSYFVTLTGTTANERAYGAELDSLGNIYIAGDIGTLNQVNLLWFNFTRAGSSDVALVKMDYQGQFIWWLSWSTPSNDSFPNVIVDDQDSIYFVFMPTSSPITLWNANYTATYANNNVALAKITTTGYVEWMAVIDGISNDQVNNGDKHIALDTNGNVYVLLETNSSDIIVSWYNISGASIAGLPLQWWNDVAIIKLSNTWSLLDYTLRGTPANESIRFSAIQVLPDNKILASFNTAETIGTFANDQFTNLLWWDVALLALFDADLEPERIISYIDGTTWSNGQFISSITVGQESIGVASFANPQNNTTGTVIIDGKSVSSNKTITSIKVYDTDMNTKWEAIEPRGWQVFVGIFDENDNYYTAISSYLLESSYTIFWLVSVPRHQYLVPQPSMVLMLFNQDGILQSYNPIVTNDLGWYIHSIDADFNYLVMAWYLWPNSSTYQSRITWFINDFYQWSNRRDAFVLSYEILRPTISSFSPTDRNDIALVTTSGEVLLQRDIQETIYGVPLENRLVTIATDSGFQQIIWTGNPGIPGNQTYITLPLLAQDYYRRVRAETTQGYATVSSTQQFTTFIPSPDEICDYVIDISKDECDALVDIYLTTSGTDRIDNTYRTKINTVCNTPSQSWRFGVYCDDNNIVRQLILPNNNISGDLSNINRSDLNLTGIFLSGNYITDLWSKFFQQASLEHLDISYNKLSGDVLTDINLANIASSIRIINMEHNKITMMPNNLHLLNNITGLYLNNNLIRNVPDTIMQIPWLDSASIRIQNNCFVDMSDDVIEYMKWLFNDARDGWYTINPECAELDPDYRRCYISYEWSPIPRDCRALIDIYTINGGANRPANNKTHWLQTIQDIVNNGWNLTTTQQTLYQQGFTGSLICPIADYDEETPWWGLENNYDTKKYGGCEDKRIQSINLANNESARTGTLPASVQSRTKLKEIRLDNNNGLRLPPEIQAWEWLAIISLNNTNSTWLITQASKRQNLQELYMQDNDLQDIPNVVMSWEDLQILDLSHNTITGIFLPIRELEQISGLYLDHNHIILLPDELAQMSDLQDITLDNNKIIQIPWALLSQLPIYAGKTLEQVYTGNLIINQDNSLLSGDIDFLDTQRYTYCSELSGYIDIPYNECESLMDLRVATTRSTSGQVSNWTDSRWRFQNLTVCDPSRRGINCTSEKNIQGVYLASNSLSGSLQEMGILPFIQNFSISDNHITALPDTIGQRDSLEAIEANWNKLDQLPTSINSLQNIIRMDISNNDITILPEWFGQFDTIVELHISHNQINELPDGFWNMPILYDLIINDNKLQELPDTIGALESIYYLNAENNRLQTLPITITWRKNIWELNIWHNQISYLPDEIWYIPSDFFNTLSANSNNLELLPDTIVQLPIRSLDIQFNKLISLPKDIGYMSWLNQILANGNKLTQLPDSLRQVKNLVGESWQWFLMDNNHIYWVIPLSFITKGVIGWGFFTSWHDNCLNTGVIQAEVIQAFEGRIEFPDEWLDMQNNCLNIDLALTNMSITQANHKSVTIDIQYSNIGQNTVIEPVIQLIPQPGLAVVNTSTGDEITARFGARYGVTGDVCYDDFYQFTIGQYAQAFQTWSEYLWYDDTLQALEQEIWFVCNDCDQRAPELIAYLDDYLSGIQYQSIGYTTPLHYILDVVMRVDIDEWDLVSCGFWGQVGAKIYVQTLYTGDISTMTINFNVVDGKLEGRWITITWIITYPYAVDENISDNTQVINGIVPIRLSGLPINEVATTDVKALIIARPEKRSKDAVTTMSNQNTITKLNIGVSDILFDAPVLTNFVQDISENSSNITSIEEVYNKVENSSIYIPKIQVDGYNYDSPVSTSNRPPNLYLEGELELRPTGGGSSITIPVVINNLGFGLAEKDIPSGSYHVGIKSDAHLLKVLRNIVIQDANVVLDFTEQGTFQLRAGDFTNDNKVNDVDLSTLLGNYLSDWYKTDINMNGLVNDVDLSILIGNYLLQWDSF